MLRSNDSHSEVPPDDDDGKPFSGTESSLDSENNKRTTERELREKYEFHLWSRGRPARRETKLQSIAVPGERFFLPIDLRRLEDLITIFLSAFSLRRKMW
jgi:hypothetical protein